MHKERSKKMVGVKFVLLLVLVLIFGVLVTANNETFCSEFAGCRECQNDLECYCEYSKTVVTIPCIISDSSSGLLDFYNNENDKLLCPPLRQGKEVVLQHHHQFFKGCDLCSVDGDRRYCVCYHTRKDRSREHKCKTRYQKVNVLNNVDDGAGCDVTSCDHSVAWTLGFLNVVQFAAMAAAVAFVIIKRNEEEKRLSKQRANQFRLKCVTDVYEVPKSAHNIDNTDSDLYVEMSVNNKVPEQPAPRKSSDYVFMSNYENI